MGTVAPFRIKGGISLDGKVEFQVFSSAPSGAKADKMGVGSLAVAGDTGKWYRKTTIGAGPDKWSSLTTDADLIGLAPQWRPSVWTADTRDWNTIEDFKAYVDKIGIIGDTDAPVPSDDVKRVLLSARLLGEDQLSYGGELEVGGYPRAKVNLLSGNYIYRTSAITGATAAAESEAGNSYTFLADIVPANLTETTAVITGTDLVVHLKNNGTASTATFAEVIAAIEAIDTDGLFKIARTYEGEFEEYQLALTFDAISLTSFSGGHDPLVVEAPTRWMLGTVDVDRIGLESDIPGDWTGWVLIQTSNSLDGNPNTTATIDEVARTITCHLGNNGTAITATVLETRNAFKSALLSTTYGRIYDNQRPLYQTSAVTAPSANVVQTEGTYTLTETGARWPVQVRLVPKRAPSASAVDGAGYTYRGDTMFVEKGFESGSVWFFSDDLWIKQGQSGSTESAFIQAFVGKTGNGSEMPTYSSTDVVTQGTNLEVAIGELDAEAGGTMGFVGKSEGDAMPSYGSTNAVTQSASLKDGISQLDLEVGYLQAFLGKAKGNEAPAYTTTKVVGQGTSLETAVSALDDLLGAAKKESASANITTELVVDSIIMEQDLAAEWIVHAREVANPGNVYASKVFAIHNANIGLAATQADFAESFILETGQKITGFEISMDMEVAGPLNARTMRLLISSTDAVDVTLSREVLRRTA